MQNFLHAKLLRVKEMTFSNLIAKVQMRYQGFLKVKSIIPVVTIQELLYGYISCKMLLTEIKYHVLIVDKEETKKHGFVLKHVINILLGTCYYHNAQSYNYLCVHISYNL